jgi:hypothetical protein
MDMIRLEFEFAAAGPQSRASHAHADVEMPPDRYDHGPGPIAAP